MVMVEVHAIDMMTDQLGISILCAPVAAMDRRALSQAWYSALRLTDRAPRATCAPLQSHATAAAQHREPRAHRGGAEVEATPVAARAIPSLDRTARLLAGLPERRASRSSLARRIERTFLRPASDVKHATFRIEGTQARVHVALQTAGNRVRLVAVCRRELQGRVRAALTQARFALASRGIVLDIETEGAACS